MIILTELTYLATSWSIYQEFGWQVWKRIGADRRIAKGYLWYQVFLCILKFGTPSSHFDPRFHPTISFL